LEEDKSGSAMPPPKAAASVTAASNGHEGEGERDGAATASAGIAAPSSIGAEKLNSDNNAGVCDDLDTVIRRMQDDLTGMHRSINMRAASLQASAEEQLFEQRRVKRREEECSSLVAKHTQLMKKKKEAQSKKMAPKSSKEHEDWLPW
jgi:Skp family chaperone for outer membrane proteins